MIRAGPNRRRRRRHPRGRVAVIVESSGFESSLEPVAPVAPDSSESVAGLYCPLLYCLLGGRGAIPDPEL